MNPNLTIRHKKSENFRRQLEEYAERLESLETFDLTAEGTYSLGAWFLGPKAENQGLLLELLKDALDDHCSYRREYFPEDPIWITPEVKDTPEYKKAVEKFKRYFGDMGDALMGSVPFFSYRYQGHMNWDITMPGLLGYFGAMLYNQNNVAAEASPITTVLEMKVGDDLCRMLGYHVPIKNEPAKITPWGHITCDGTVANMESMWACRNLKFYPVSLAEALRNESSLAAARYMTIRLPQGGRETLINLDTWQLLNLDPDEVLEFPTRIQEEYGISTSTLQTAFDNYNIQNLGFSQFYQLYLRGRVGFPVMFAPSTMHYSWPKSAAVLGLGSNNMIPVHVDLNARMEINHLRSLLDAALANRQPVMMVVAVIGSTEESAVDPLADIIALRKEYAQAGLVFPVHSDAAWGGYFASLLRRDPYAKADLSRRQFTPELSMSEYVNKQYRALKDANSITVDPHKAGYIPYPAGGLCYQNSAMRNLVSWFAPVVYHGGVDPTVGVYGIEGSKPGAAAAGVFLSHRVVRTNQSGYGQILGKSLFNSKRLYSAVITMADESDDFIVALFQRLPAQKQGLSPEKVKEQLEYIKTQIVPKTNDELIADHEAMTLLKELGSDQIIISYAFNFKQNGVLNPDVTAANNLNFEIFKLLSLAPPKFTRALLGESDSDVPTVPMIITQSSFDPAVYGQALVDDFRDRLGITEGDPSTPVNFLISTTMDPWLTDTAAGNFIPTLIAALKSAVEEAIGLVLTGQASGG